MVDSPFVLNRLDPQPQFMNSSDEDIEKRAQALGTAITFPTVSFNSSYTNTTALDEFHTFLRQNYAHIFNGSLPFIKVHVVNRHSLLIRVEGQIATSNPYLLCGHLDVVPVGNGQWSKQPFSGEIYKDETDGENYIFGRGAIDNKQSVIGLLETLSYIVVKLGGRPRRTFYIAFGHDEEVGGHKGAGKISEKLKQILTEENEQLSFILDEGMFIMDNVFPGVSDPVAYVGK